MMLLVFVAAALLVALLTGGSLKHLARVQVRCSWLVLLSLAVQILIFSEWFQQHAPQAERLASLLYGLSLLLLVVVVALNGRVPGFRLIALGLALNTLVILTNGGRMPASLAALRFAGIGDATEAYAAARATNSAVITAATRFWFLGDVFASPASWPLSNVFSIGDICIMLGAICFVWVHTHPKAS
jgi:hypothetical protein